MWKWHIPVFVFLSTLAAALALLLIITTYTITDAFIAYVNSHRAGDKARQNELALKAAATTPDALKKPTGETGVGRLHHQVDRVLRLGSASFARGSPREKKNAGSPGLSLAVRVLWEQRNWKFNGGQASIPDTRLFHRLQSLCFFLLLLLLPLMSCTVHSETLRGGLCAEQLRGRHSARWWTKCFVIPEEDVKVDGT